MTPSGPSKVLVVVSLVDPSAKPPVRVRVFSSTSAGWHRAQEYMVQERRNGALDVSSFWEEAVGG